MIINSLTKILHPGSKGQDADTPHFLVIIGDYGVGKTLLLDAATQKLDAHNAPVFYFCALDYKVNLNDKNNDDVLDVKLRSVIQHLAQDHH